MTVILIRTISSLTFNVAGNGEAFILYLQPPLGKNMNENGFQVDTEIEIEQGF